MNRAMFSGVSGLKAHQTKMDVIGNNIANVNTYGYKAQRAVFSDIYYQSLRGASAGTATKGGTNPSSVGYGSNLSAIQSQMTTSSMQNTGFGLDVAITGEGFIQVQDGSGNIFYTKAGLLDYDANGYLIDLNGNFVLGASGTDTEPGSDKIKLDNIGSVDPTKPSITTAINGIEYTISASNSTQYGNVSLAIGASEDLPAGMKASASIASSGAISVQLNAFEKFGSMAELNNAINEAITEANGGTAHPAGTFTIESDVNVFGKDATIGSLTGGSTQNPLTVTAGNDFFGGKLSIGEFKPKDAFTSSADGTIKVTEVIGSTLSDTASHKVSVTINGIEYTATMGTGSTFPLELKAATPNEGTLMLEKTENTDGLTAGDFATMVTNTAGSSSPTLTVTAPSYFLGGATIIGVSANFPKSGKPVFTASAITPTASTDGGYDLEIEVNGKTYTGIAVPGTDVIFKSNDPDTAIADADGTITMKFPTKDEMLKNLGLATNAGAGAIQTALEAKDGAGMHTYNLQAAQGASVKSLTGAQIVGTAGGVDVGTITGTNIADGFFDGTMKIEKVSGDFEGSGTVEPTDFKATYTEADSNAGTLASWEIIMNIGGKQYTGTVDKDTASKSLLLKGPNGDYIQVSNPGFEEMSATYSAANGNVAPTAGKSMQASKSDANNNLTVTASKDSENLGLGSDTLNLVGGTEGGTITLEQLSDISIGSNGVVTVSHASKGVVVAGKISLANFANPSGLQLKGSNYYAQTVNSGDPSLSDPGSGGTGALKNSALEMSNVDLSDQMAEMITTQRGFQANSRVITVTDTMLEELINLKR